MMVIKKGKSLLQPCVLGIFLLATPASSGEKIPSITSKRLGSYIGGGRGVYLSESDWTEDVKRAKHLGIGVVRFNSDIWNALEPSPGRFDWARLDRIVELINAEGIELLFTLPISNSWNYTGEEAKWYGRKIGRTHHLTRDTKSVERFVEALARRYKGKINYYELWNEPDFPPYWQGKPNAEEYVSFARVAYPAVKRGNPQATVLLGGLADPSNDKWLSAFYKAGGDAFFDVMNIHVYPAFTTLEKAISTVRGQKPIWITETSTTGLFFETKDREKEEHEKAVFLVKNFSEALSNPDVQRIFWHCVRNPGRDVGLDRDFDFGLMTSSGEPLPAHRALEVFTQKLIGSRPIGRVGATGDPSTVAYRFETPAKIIFVVWSTSSSGRFTTPQDGGRAFQWNGDELRNGVEKRSVRIGREPIYVEIKKKP